MNHYRITVLICVFIHLIASIANGKDHTVVALKDGSAHVSLNTAVETCIDSSGAWTIDTLLTRKFDQYFLPANGRVNFGYSDTPTWMRCTLRNESMNINEWCVNIQYAAINSVQCYIIDGDTVLRELNSGIEVPYVDREVHHQYHVFPIAMQREQEVTFYLKIYSQYAILVPIEVSSFKEFFSQDRDRTYVLGFLFGAMIALILYNTFLFVTVRDISYLWYCLYAVFFGAYLGARDNLFGQFSFLDHPAAIFYIIALGSGGVCVFGPLFAIEFLQLKKISKTLYHTMIGMVYIGTLYSVIVVLQPLATSKLLNVVAPLYAISTVFIGILAWRKGSAVAFLYVVATSILALSIVFRIFRTTGVIQMNFLSEHGVQIGIVLEMTILAVALGYRIKTLKEEKESERQHLRAKIASDIHDDVSSTLSSIDFYAEALKKSKSISNKKGKQLQELILLNTRDAKEKITDIVWSLHPQEETWESFSTKCRRFAEEMLESKEIRYQINIQHSIAPELTMEQKYHLWLIFKEIITNICRHSMAVNANVRIGTQDRLLYFMISDNGKGFNEQVLKRINGMSNIRKRVQELGGTATLKTSPHQGTEWRVQIPI